MRIVFYAVLLSALTASAHAESISRPTFTAGDNWSYHLSIQSGATVKESHINVAVMRVGSDGIVVSQKSDVNPDRVQSAMFGLDWSKRRSVNGQETTVNQPFSFPLDVGKTWRLEYTEANPNPQKLRETDVLPYKVVGWEEITTPARQFRALKIESEGRWTADLAPRVLNSAVVARQGAVAAQTTENRVVQSVRLSGRYYKCFWYVPELKRWVKSIEEDYSSNGSLSQVATDELESFHVGGAKTPENAPGPAAPAIPPAAPGKSAI